MRVAEERERTEDQEKMETGHGRYPDRRAVKTSTEVGMVLFVLEDVST